MSIAPHSGIVDFGTFTSPAGATDGIQGEVPAPLAIENGYVLTTDGWVSASSLGLVNYQGTWDAATNNPTLVSSVGITGGYYVVSVAGSTNLNGITSWFVGDWAIFNGTVWQKVNGTILGTMAYQNANAVAITGGTITETRINPRVSSTTSTATLTVNSDSFDQAVLTAQAVALSVAAPTGTPVNGQKLTLRFKDNATAQTISWTTTSGGFRAIGCTLPTTTVISKVVYIGCIYNSDESFWDVVSVGQQI